MKHILYLMVGMFSLALAHATAAEEKNQPLKPEAKAAKDKLFGAGEVAGKVIDFNRDERRVTVQVQLRYIVPNPDGVARHQELQQQLAAALQLPDPAERFPAVRDAQVALLQNQPNLVMLKEEQHDVPMQYADDVRVRLMQPPLAFDDKGRPRKYTAEELKELKGKENLIGYRGELDNVRVNQLVRVFLVRRVPAKPDPAARLVDPPQPQAAYIVIVAEPPPQ